MELKLQPVMTRLHPIRDIERALRFAAIYEGKLSPVIRLFFRIGLHAYESGSVPRDPMRLQALLEQEKDAESNERLPARRPRIDPFHLILEAIFRSFKSKRRPEFALARSGKHR
ncbi:hypothetical protein LCGC14_1501420 [marine sediment metagenome]|uniref:Uncharacterized protein n=1 Tax=marine sediment metagenome TaxID=412755 RepID=A0A0F9JPU4_9ZZZZ